MKAKRRGDPFVALGNRYRRQIIEILAREPSSVQELADRLPISRPAVSRHLKLLSGAGIVVDEQDGTRRLYRLDREHLARVWTDAAARFKLYAENTRRRTE